MGTDGLTPSEAARLLGIAWVGSGLYPDPGSQESFRRVAEQLAATPAPLDFQPMPTDLLCNGESIGELGGALHRFTDAAFRHDVSIIRILPGVDPYDLAQFLQLVAVEPAALAGVGGLGGAVRARDVRGIEVGHSQLLTAGERADAASPGVEVDLLVARLLETLPSESSAVFLEELASMVEEQPTSVAAYLDAFTRLDEATQEAIILRLMEDSESGLQDTFLGQLSGHDLAGLQTTLSPRTAEFLSDYAGYADGARQLDAEAALLDPESLLTFRSEVAGRIEERLSELELTEAVKTVDMPGKASWTPAVQETMRGMFLVEDRGDRVDRAIRAWSRLLGASIQRGSFAEAVGWIEAGAPLAEQHPSVFDGEIEGVAERGIASLFSSVNAGNDSAKVLLDRFGPLAIEEACRLLGELTEPPARKWVSSRLPVWLDGEIEPLLAALESHEAVPVLLGEISKLDLDLSGERRIADLLHDDRATVRRKVLEMVGTSLPIDTLGGLLDDPSSDVRMLSFRAMSVHAERERALPKLAEVLQAAPANEQVALASLMTQTTEGQSFVRSRGSGLRAYLTADGRRWRELAGQVLRR
ncbi:MAG: hypothetical protein HKN46_10970 [Acidimicrobiia bacterium]|nr:hypothetical protein [Acidimicrobiia bacterium]